MIPSAEEKTKAMFQTLVGLREAIRFPGDIYVLFGFTSAVYWYGVWPFLNGFLEELESPRPGMMTLISIVASGGGVITFFKMTKLFRIRNPTYPSKSVDRFSKPRVDVHTQQSALRINRVSLCA